MACESQSPRRGIGSPESTTTAGGPSQRSGLNPLVGESALRSMPRHAWSWRGPSVSIPSSGNRLSGGVMTTLRKGDVVRLSQSPRRGIGSPEYYQTLITKWRAQGSQSPRRGIGSPELFARVLADSCESWSQSPRRGIGSPEPTARSWRPAWRLCLNPLVGESALRSFTASRWSWA